MSDYGMKSDAVHSLREIVSGRVDVCWEKFAAEHEHLAAAVERVRLVDIVVDRLSDDEAYCRAMEAAGGDEVLLAATTKLIDEIDNRIGRIFGL